MSKKDFVYRKEGLKLTKADEIVVEQREDIRELKERLYITEKALELACEDKPRPINYYGNYMGSVNDYIEFYKTKAKEMRSE